MMLYKKFVTEGIWPSTVSAFVEGRPIVRQHQDRMFQRLLNTKAPQRPGHTLQL